MKIFNIFHKKRRLTADEVVQYLAQQIVYQSFLGSIEVNDIAKEAPRISVSKHTTNACYELMYIMLHCVDRIAYSNLSLSEREAFMNKLQDYTIDIYTCEAHAGASDDDKMAISHAIIETYNERTITYSQYNELYPNKDATFKGTLLWEAAKMISVAYEADNDIIYITQSMPILMKALNELNTVAVIRQYATGAIRE